MKRPFRIGLLQISSLEFDQAANLQKGLEYCRQAKELGCDLAMFPEMWSIGYTMPEIPRLFEDGDPNALDANEKKLLDEWHNRAISRDGVFVRSFQELAKEEQIAIAISYLEKTESKPHNSVSLIDMNGDIALHYSKVHTCDFSYEAALTSGEEFKVAELDIGHDRVKIGAMICYDREFPESARVLMMRGAEIIVIPNACTLETHRLEQFRTRAFENMTGMAMANYPTPKANGHSIAVSPIAFDSNEESLETTIIEAGEGEGIFIADFDMTAIREYRARETWGDAYRKPDTYSDLLE